MCADLSELNLACRCECAPRVYCVHSRYHCIAVSSVRERNKGERERALKLLLDLRHAEVVRNLET